VNHRFDSRAWKIEEEYVIDRMGSSIKKPLRLEIGNVLSLAKGWRQGTALFYQPLKKMILVFRKLHFPCKSDK
jgi:hypothetical protein